MRAIHILLAIYVLCLALIPCSDAAIERTGRKSHAEHSHSASPHDHDQHPEESCTPFCTCNCCRTNIIFLDFDIPYSSIITFFNFNHPITDQDLVSLCDQSIWQPPKLS